MMLRSALSLTVLGLLCGAAQAQPFPPSYYPPAGMQAYPPARPLPPAAVDDDDDDLPPHLRAAPGNYPPPPGGYQFPDQRAATPPRGIQREALPSPGGAAAPSYGPPPAVVYGNRGPEPYPQAYPPAYPPPSYGRGPAGSGQPESYGVAPAYPPAQAAVPQQYGAPPAYGAPPPYGAPPAYQDQPGQGPMQIGPGPGMRPPGDVAGRDPAGAGRPNTVAMLPPEEQPEQGKAELPPHLKRQLVPLQSNEPAGTLVIDTANT